ncbi:hypothetical protein AHAS_Ahas14G0024600 [Arachis hypogaea]
MILFFNLSVGFGLPKISRKVVPERDCPGDCVNFIFLCHPKIPTCVNGFCVCTGLDNNNSTTKQERHD